MATLPRTKNSTNSTDCKRNNQNSSYSNLSCTMKHSRTISPTLSSEYKKVSRCASPTSPNGTIIPLEVKPPPPVILPWQHLSLCHTSATSRVICSPSSPQCFDTIEEEMIFPMFDDVKEENECYDERNSKAHASDPKDTQKTIGIIPKIIKEDFDCDCEQNLKLRSGRNCCQEQLHPGGLDITSQPKPSKSKYSKVSNNLISKTTASNKSKNNSTMADCNHEMHPHKQRMRSLSGPAYPIAFRQSVLNNHNSHKPNEDAENDGCSTSLRSRISPNGPGGSFFDNLRPRSTSTSESKNKKKSPSVISVIKNSFLGSTTGGTNMLANNQSFSSGNSSASSNSSNVAEPQSTSGQSCQLAPTSPIAIVDPFSLERLHARHHSADCPQHPNFYQQYHHHHSFHGHKPSQQSIARPRSRSSAGGMGPMGRMFDMFRGRSNSICQTNAASESGCICNSTITHQDSLCERSIEYEDVDENLIYVRFFKFYRCYDLIPISAKLVVFDTQLAVKKAFFALLSNGIRAAPLWDSNRHEFVGMLTITDFINILRAYYNSPQHKMEELEEHKVDNWKSMLKEKARSMVSIAPDESLFKAIKMLIHNKVHRLPVIDPETGNVLYVLTHKRLLKFMFLYYYTRLPMPSYLTKTLKELKIGTYNNISVITQNTPLIQALNIMIEKRVSALPVVDKKNKVIDIYSKFDVIHLAADKMYQDLDISVKEALEYRNTFESVIKCTLNDTLHCTLEKTVQAEVHRIVVVDSDDRVIGIVSLSDLLTFLVLKPVGLEKKEGHIKSIAEVFEESAEETMRDSQDNTTSGSMQKDASQIVLLNDQDNSCSSSSINSTKLIPNESGNSNLVPSGQ